MTRNFLEEIADNTGHAAQSQDLMNLQMAELLHLNAQQLAVQEDQLAVQEEQLAVQQEQLGVQQQIRQIARQHLAVSEQQLVQAVRTVRRLDISNQRLARIDATLADISGVLAEQNALIQKSLNRLAAEAQELITRAVEAYNNGWIADAARDFQTALERYPYAAIAHYYLAKCHARAGRKGEARQAYEKCIWYARVNAPIFHSLALCDLAADTLAEGKPADARRLLERAWQCAEQDRTILAATLLDCDIAEDRLRPETAQAIAGAFADERVDPEVLLEVLTRKAAGVKQGTIQTRLREEQARWQQTARQVLFERLISHFYRELDDYVYLAPRVRRGFMEAAGGKFLSLGDPLADLLDWTAAIGEGLLKRINVFTPAQLAILPLFRPLGAWNALLVKLGRLTSLLAARSDLVGGRFVGQLNLGLLDLPRMYEDDRVLFEVNTEEGDTLVLSCYYAVFTRNGVAHFPVPLQDFGLLRIDTYQARAKARGVLVVDPRWGQTLIQGTTGVFEDDAGEEVYYVTLFTEAAALLQQIHEAIGWAVAHENELFSIFLLLHSISERLAGAAKPTDAGALPGSGARALPPAAAGPVAPAVDDDFEVVEEAPPAAAGDFEVVEEAPPAWFAARDRKKVGPIPWPKLQEMAAAGRLLPTDMLLQEGSKKWVAAGSVSGLAFPQPEPKEKR